MSNQEPSKKFLPMAKNPHFLTVGTATPRITMAGPNFIPMAKVLNSFPVGTNFYQITEMISHGSNSTLFKAICLQKRTVVAIKAINMYRHNSDFVSKMEEIMSQSRSLLSHSNILDVHTSFFADSDCNVMWAVMPFMSAGSLLSIVSSSFPTGLSEDYIADILRQTLNLMSYIHLNGILLKVFTLGNIFLDHHNRAIIKFGNVFYPPPRTPRNPEDISGNPYWVPPEVIKSSGGYDVKSEIWSLGILALELAHGKPPITDVPMSKSLTKKMKKRLFSANSGGCSYSGKRVFSESFKDLVKQCLEQNPGNRPTVDTLRKHCFFKRCKFPGCLLVDLLKDLPNVKDRNRFSKAAEEKKEEDSEETESRRVSGWKLDVENLVLFPTFYNESDSSDVMETETEMKRKEGPQVHFGGEKVIEDNEVMMEIDMGMVEEEDDEEEEEGGFVNEMWEETRDHLTEIVQELDDVGLDLDDASETTTTEELLTKLVFAKICLERQLNQINVLIELHGGVSNESP